MFATIVIGQETTTIDSVDIEGYNFFLIGDVSIVLPSSSYKMVKSTIGSMVKGELTLEVWACNITNQSCIPVIILTFQKFHFADEYLAVTIATSYN
ncbi:hypothetical protein NPIL_552771 [Nephila pilipes]|uniref:Uncharacterized protein n=1 Tax=Nephila pilipes TaxID=299642 RepID=A0A8X6NVX6_NEPPI|nr:hypothetical protein NPIL_552771 [Nephila pilipes]